MVFAMKMLPTGVSDNLMKLLGVHNQQSSFNGKGDMTKRIPGIGKK